MPAKHRRPVDIIIHCPGAHGAIADQVHKQATTLHELGIKVLVLCSPGYLRTRPADYPHLACMAEGATTEGGFFSRKIAKNKQIILNQLLLAWEIYRKKPFLVLTGCHTDTQAAIWIWPHILLRRLSGVVYATNLHFSSRDHSLGPKWWNTMCSNLSFKPFRIAVAHKRLAHASQLPQHIQAVEVPLGPDPTKQVYENPKTIRSSWRVPRGKKVFLAFGTIQNHKNIDLAIRALSDNPDAHLVVIGSVSSHKDKPLKYYQMLADDLGLSKRVYISDEFVADEKRLSYFKAADFILLTYAGSFHSQSATLTTAVNARRRVLASSGTSPMEDLVKHFGVGIYVEPDSSDAVADGMATLLKAALSEPNWEGYEAYATWETNVLRLLQATSDYLSRTPTKARQFEGLEEEAAEIPELLNARRLAHHRTGPQKKKSPSLTKNQNRRKSRKASPQDEREILRSQANGADFHPALPGFDSPASAPVQVNSASRTPASDTMTAADSPSPIPRARRRQRREPAAG